MPASRSSTSSITSWPDGTSSMRQPFSSGIRHSAIKRLARVADALMYALFPIRSRDRVKVNFCKKHLRGVLLSIAHQHLRFCDLQQRCMSVRSRRGQYPSRSVYTSPRLSKYWARTISDIRNCAKTKGSLKKNLIERNNRFGAQAHRSSQPSGRGRGSVLGKEQARRQFARFDEPALFSEQPPGQFAIVRLNAHRGCTPPAFASIRSRSEIKSSVACLT